VGSLFLARHSVTAASASGRNLGQSSDPPLVPAGAALAVRLGEAIAFELAELPHDDLRLISSPARRCRQTIAAVAEALGVAAQRVEVERGLIEIDYGAWEGLTPDECRARDPELRRAWEADPFSTRCPDGESGADVAARAFPVLDEVEAWLMGDRDRCAIVVAHNHVNRLRLCAHLGWPLAEYRRRIGQDAAAYSLLTFADGEAADGGSPVVRRLNASADWPSAAE
jgi:broad specificity phosphatase PhoE